MLACVRGWERECVRACVRLSARVCALRANALNVQHISDCPPHTRPCTHITQASNGLGDAGIEKIAGALEKMAGMQSLDLVRGGGACGVAPCRP